MQTGRVPRSVKYVGPNQSVRLWPIYMLDELFPSQFCILRNDFPRCEESRWKSIYMFLKYASKSSMKRFSFLPHDHLSSQVFKPVALMTASASSSKARSPNTSASSSKVLLAVST